MVTNQYILLCVFECVCDHRWLTAPLQLLCAAAMPTLTEIGFGSAGAVIRQREGIMGKWSCGVICCMNIFHSECVCLPLCHGVDFDYRFTHTLTTAAY